MFITFHCESIYRGLAARFDHLTFCDVIERIILSWTSLIHAFSLIWVSSLFDQALLGCKELRIYQSI